MLGAPGRWVSGLEGDCVKREGARSLERSCGGRFHFLKLLRVLTRQSLVSRTCLHAALRFHPLRHLANVLRRDDLFLCVRPALCIRCYPAIRVSSLTE